MTCIILSFKILIELSDTHKSIFRDYTKERIEIIFALAHMLGKIGELGSLGDTF